jgi:tRNA-dihydrouridine synthase
MGNDPDLLAEAGAVVQAAGADVVDLNLGCPTSNAAKKGVGAALLKQPELLQRLLTTMRRGVSGRLSAKLRAGFDSTHEALRNARLVEDAGLDFIAVHPRRGIDAYRGRADWRIVEQIRRELTIPVVGNGDIWYADSALRLFEQTNCDAVMIGRPALRNPWIFRQLAELNAAREAFRPSGADVAQHLRRLAEALVRRGSLGYVPLGPLKEQLGYLFRAVPDTAFSKLRVLQQQTLPLLLEACDEAFSALEPEQLDLGPRPAQPS